MSNRLERHPLKGELCELFERGASLREISRMIGGSKSTIDRLRREWLQDHPQVQPPSKELVRTQVRAREMRERIEGLLEIAERKNDLKASVRLLAALDSLDRRILSPTSRRQPENLRVQIVYERPSDGAKVDARQYLSDATRELGWKVALRVVFEAVAQLSNVDSRIYFAMENLLDIIEEVENGVATESNPSDSRERA